MHLKESAHKLCLFGAVVCMGPHLNMAALGEHKAHGVVVTLVCVNPLPFPTSHFDRGSSAETTQ